MLHWVAARISRSGFYSPFYAQKPCKHASVVPSFLLSVRTVSLSLLRRTYFTSFTSWIREGCSNTTCFLGPPPGSGIRPLHPCFFFSSPRSASSLFIYSWMPVLLLIILQRIWVGFVSAVLGFIYSDVLTHILSLGWLCQRMRWSICDCKAEIIILNLLSMLDKLSFHHDWWIFWDIQKQLILQLTCPCLNQLTVAISSTVESC